MLQHGRNIQHKETVSLPGCITALIEQLKATGQHMPREMNVNQVTHTAESREELKNPTVVSLWNEGVVPLTNECKHTRLESATSSSSARSKHKHKGAYTDAVVMVFLVELL